MQLVLFSLTSLILGVIGGFFYQKSRSSNLITEKELLRQETENSKQKLAELQKIIEEISRKNEILQEKVSALEIRHATAEEQKNALEGRINEQKVFISEAQNIMKEQFENIANRQLQENNKKFVEDSSQNLGNILKPLSENIEKFKKEFSETYDKEARERFALGKEIQRIVEVNNRMTSTTDNLTKALRGDNKAQGNWGEVILERLLEDAGLQKGKHFKTQEGFLNDEGKMQLPDVIIQLPENKHIVVDSKVSLVSYEKYFSEEEESQKILHARSFIESVKNHIKGLGQKSYQDNENFSTLDFVIMFMPIEGTFQLAQQYDADIFSFGWNKKVVITSPATLFPILKTISSIWKVDAQNNNTQEIIKTATALYEKFMSFAESLEDVGKNIERTDKAYKESISRLKNGRGNAISIVKKLEEYGIERKGNKKLPDLAQDISEEEMEEEAS